MGTSGRCKTPNNGLKKSVPDVVMIGRAAMGNPTSSTKSTTTLKQEKSCLIWTFEDKMKIAYEHFAALINLQGEHLSFTRIPWSRPHYLRGTSGCSQTCGAISQASTLAEIEELSQLKA